MMMKFINFCAIDGKKNPGAFPMLRSVAGFFSQPTNDGKKAMLAPLHNATIVALFFFFFAQLMKKKKQWLAIFHNAAFFTDFKCYAFA